MQIKKVDGIPVLTEYIVTVLIEDLPHVEYFYDQHKVKNLLNKLDKLSKKYILDIALHIVH